MATKSRRSSVRLHAARKISHLLVVGPADFSEDDFFLFLERGNCMGTVLVDGGFHAFDRFVKKHPRFAQSLIKNPVVWIGDNDSGQVAPRAWLSFTYFLPAQKAVSDFEFAMGWVKKNFRSHSVALSLVGFSGGRADHELGVQIALIHSVSRSFYVFFSRPEALLVYFRGPVRVEGRQLDAEFSSVLSIFSLTPRTLFRKFAKFEYTLKRGVLRAGSHGLSNERTGNDMVLDCTQGRAVLILNRKDPAA